MQTTTPDGSTKRLREPKVMEHSRADSTAGTTLVVDLNGGWGRRFAQTVASEGPVVVFDRASFAAARAPLLPAIKRLVLVLPQKWSTGDREILERCAALAAEHSQCRVCLVGSFRVHFDDRAQAAVESDALGRCEKTAPGRCVVLRVGSVLSPSAAIGGGSRLLAVLYPLVAPRFRSGFLTEEELFDALGEATAAPLHGRSRTYTVLGTNRRLREVWADRASFGPIGRCLTAVAYVLNFLLVGRMIGGVFGLFARLHPPLRSWMFDTLEPSSVRELLQLYNPWNRRYVALAGYNTGVIHFGWRYSGKTVVKTTGCGRLVRLSGEHVDVDAGITIKRVVEELNVAERQLFVVPNYSYVSLGTTFFVPVHGSGNAVSTLGDTIEKVLVYDPTSDRIRSVRRGEGDFGRWMYAPRSGVLVLRLRFRTCSQARYFMRRYTLESPTADEIWRTFADDKAANIELRKPAAAAKAVQVTKFYTTPFADEAALEVPRDAIGRLWDKLEENPLTSLLFHGLSRRYAFHVELFLDEHEFRVFWQNHAALPLLKIQLRFVRRDGLVNSPFGECDCISADLFMRRAASAVFLKFMKEKLPHARFNPGKHSM